MRLEGNCTSYHTMSYRKQMCDLSERSPSTTPLPEEILALERHGPIDTFLLPTGSTRKAAMSEDSLQFTTVVIPLCYEHIGI